MRKGCRAAKWKLSFLGAVHVFFVFLGRFQCDLLVGAEGRGLMAVVFREGVSSSEVLCEGGPLNALGFRGVFFPFLRPFAYSLPPTPQLPPTPTPPNSPNSPQLPFNHPPTPPPKPPKPPKPSNPPTPAPLPKKAKRVFAWLRNSAGPSASKTGCQARRKPCSLPGAF